MSTLTPSQLLMERRPRNTLPAASDILRPKGQNLDRIKQSLQSIKDKQKASFDIKFRNKELLPLYPTDPVRIMPTQGERKWVPGTIVKNIMKHLDHISYKLKIASCVANT